MRLCNVIRRFFLPWASWSRGAVLLGALAAGSVAQAASFVAQADGTYKYVPDPAPTTSGGSTGYYDGTRGMRSDGSGGVKWTDKAPLHYNPGGPPADVTGDRGINKARVGGKVAKAGLKFIAGVSGVAAAAGLLGDIWDIWQEVGVGLEDDGQGGVRPVNLNSSGEPGQCYAGDPCYAYLAWGTQVGAITWPWPPAASYHLVEPYRTQSYGDQGYADSNAIVCAAIQASNPGYSISCQFAFYWGGGSRAQYQIYKNGSYVAYYDIFRNTATTNDEQSYDVITEAEIAALITAESGWPDPEDLARALAKAQTDPEVAADPLIDTPVVPDLTGPATTDGETKVQQNPDGTTTTITTTYNFNYNGDTVTTTTTTITNHYDPQTNTTTTTTTETTAPPVEQPVDECEEFPDRVSCMDVGDIDDEVPTDTVNVSYTPEELGLGSGSCPAGPSWTDSLGSHSINLQPYCDAVTTWVRPVMLAFFAFGALMICLGGIRGEV